MINKELIEIKSQKKNLEKNLKEKDERIIALQNEIELKEREENRKEKGKLKESGMLNELKFNEDIIINDFNELGKSQNEIEKENTQLKDENEKLKDEIMILKKDLELAKYYQENNLENKDEQDNNIIQNNSIKIEEEKPKEINKLKNGLISSLDLSEKSK